MEYEYSCKVKDLLPFIKYCLNNNYELKDEYEQTRILYKNDGKVMARITRNNKIDEDTEILDFKEDNLDKEILKIRKAPHAGGAFRYIGRKCRLYGAVYEPGHQWENNLLCIRLFLYSLTMAI